MPDISETMLDVLREFDRLKPGWTCNKLWYHPWDAFRFSASHWHPNPRTVRALIDCGLLEYGPAPRCEDPPAREVRRTAAGKAAADA